MSATHLGAPMGAFSGSRQAPSPRPTLQNSTHLSCSSSSSAHGGAAADRRASAAAASPGGHHLGDFLPRGRRYRRRPLRSHLQSMAPPHPGAVLPLPRSRRALRPLPSPRVLLPGHLTEGTPSPPLPPPPHALPRPRPLSVAGKRPPPVLLPAEAGRGRPQRVRPRHVRRRRLLALRRSPASSCNPVRICVCDPVAGTSTFLPPLPPTTFPENGSSFWTPTTFPVAGIVILDADGSSFRLLAVMNQRPMGIRLRVFSSQTGQWGTAMTAQLPHSTVVHLCSTAVVHRGAVHWICGTRALPNAVHALAVRPGQAEVSVCRFDLPLRAGIHRLNHAGGAVRLRSSAQGCLSLVLLDDRVISIWNFRDNGTDGRPWELHKTVHLASVLPSTIFDPSAEWGLSVVASCDQSGSLFLRAVAEEGGLFVLNLETEVMSRVCNDQWRI